MQQRTTAGADASGSMPDPLRQPTEYLLAFLNRIAMLDKEGFFQRPVREEEAPNYYSIIKQPMCFADMREKINSGAYQAWRQLRDDFNLIHENARRFNSNKTLVHRAALNLQKNGSKILANFELEVRKALAVLHPLGAQQPAASAPGAQAPASGASTMAGDPRTDLAMSPMATATVSGIALAVEHNGDGGGFDGGCQRPSMSGPPSPEGAVDGGALPMAGSAPATGLVAHPFASSLLTPTPRDVLVGYISDEDDQPLLVVGTDAAAATAASAASRSLPGLGPTHALPLDALLLQLRTTAVRVPYSRPGRREGDKLSCSSSSASAEESAAEGGTYPSASTSPVPSREWRQARRPVELKARWLELRMRELSSQHERLQTQISWLQQRKAAGGESLMGAALAAGLGRPAVGVLVAASSLAAAPCAAERDALGTAAGEFMSAGRVSSSLYFWLRTLPAPVQGAVAAGSPLAPGGSATAVQMGAPAGPQAAAEVPSRAGASPEAAASPRCASESQATASATAAANQTTSTQSEALRRAMPPPQPPAPPQGLQQQQHGPGRPAAQPQPLLPQQLSPWDETESDKMQPGAIFASLELLEQRLSVVRARLQDSYKFDPNRLAVGRVAGPFASRASSYQLTSSGSLAVGQQMLPAGPSAGHGAVKRQSSGQGRRPGSLTVLTRFDSMSLPACKSTGAGGGGKRKRSEIELLTGDFGTPLASYGRTSLDRSASLSAIVIPPVRELPPDEFRARIVAATTWSQHYHTIGPSALDSVPSEIQSVLRKRRRRGLCAIGEDHEDDLGGMGAGTNRGLPGTSDDENGALLASGMGGPGAGLGGCSDSGVGDDEGSSSSSEDTGDEAYAARHRIMEEEEHRRYAAVVAEGQRRRNKGGSNASGGQQNTGGGGGAASQAKERAKVGNKTPRYSNSFKLKEGLMLIPPELPPDAMDSALPSAMYSHYQPYAQLSMTGVTTSAMPPTPGSTIAAMQQQPQPTVLQQAAAQRTSSPPVTLHALSAGAPGQSQQQQLQTSAPAVGQAVATVMLPAQVPASAKLSSPQAQVQQLQPAPPPLLASDQPVVAIAGEVPAPAAALMPPAGPQHAQHQQSPLPPAQAQVSQQLHVQSQAQAAPQSQPEPQRSPVSQQPHSQGAQHAQGPQALPQQLIEHSSPQPAAVQQPPSGSDTARGPAPNAGTRTELESAGPTGQAGDTAASEAGAAAVGSHPVGGPAAPAAAPQQAAEAAEAPGISTVAPAAAEPSGEPVPTSAPAGPELSGPTEDATPSAAAATDGSLAKPASAAAAMTTSGATEAQTMAAAASGTAPAIAAMTTAAQQAALSVGATNLAGTAFLGNSAAAAAMIAQSPGMSMQFLSGMQGLGAGIGTGGSNNALSAAATSILLAAAAAASAGGQNAANSLMGNARTNALQQLAAGTPAAQVFANAAAAAAAAAAAGAPGGSGTGLTGLGQQAKQQQPPPLFTAAASRAMTLSSTAQGQAALAAAAAAGGMSGIGGISGISGLPAAFQSLSGFQQSLAGVTGFNFNLAGGGVGLGLQPGQRLADGLGGLGMLPQGPQHLQSHQLHQSMQAPPMAPRQGQPTGQTEVGRGAGRGRRTSRTTAVEDEDEDWGDEEEEEEEAASPRTRRSTRAQRRGSNGMREGHGNGSQEATRQSRRRAAKGAHNWAVLLASDSSDEEEDEEWAARAARRTHEGGRGRGRGRRSAG